MFEGAVERRLLRTVVYVAVFIAIAFLAFVNLIYGVKFSTEQKDAWLLGIATGVLLGTTVVPCVVGGVGRGGRGLPSVFGVLVR